ncbi:uncharacterized protein AMSG_04189 [Thecamonas trahens ATCC 50062]|uniref:GRAM domain-containing protein n=1 Tax=Thecamonas trahens ATCC 50062 TaxID=461836 RepID=A0A0L0D6W6_THETB|nr:hypothetical protein AMSG_04189 [Thecamonas trahens ATCC 50062]KNC47955.1 hypothetical protein AMSG_04189 [Thecamonas trahens ATCC 50062]|eukprot:XP_013758972.1 hypothetical protein AMSG_04189 [Thecamonas trahens ATCC 50062]
MSSAPPPSFDGAPPPYIPPTSAAPKPAHAPPSTPSSSRAPPSQSAVDQVARKLAGRSVSDLHALIMLLVSADALACESAITFLASPSTGPPASVTAPAAPDASSAPPPASSAVGAAAAAAGAAGATAATYKMTDVSPSAPAAPAAPPPEKKKKRGFMKSITSTFNDMKQSATLAKAQMGVAMGVTYDAKKFRAAFELAPDQPMLADAQCVLLNGASPLSGQMYITPSLLCVYTITHSKEVKVKIDMLTITHIIARTCPNYKNKKEEPVIIDTPHGSRANVLQVYCNDGLIHTVVLDPTKMEPIATWLHLIWDRTLNNGQRTLPVLAAPTPVHTAFKLHQSEPVLGESKCKLINGTDAVSVVFHLFLNYFGFEVAGSPVLIPYTTVSSIVAARASKMAGSPVPVYTTDGCMHQFFNFSGDFFKLHAQVIYCHAMASGAAPVHLS